MKPFQQALKEIADHIAVIITDLTGKVLAFNQGAEKLCGFTSDEILNEEMPLHDFQKTILSIPLHINESIKTSLVHKNGDIIPVQLEISTVTAEHSNDSYLFIAKPLSSNDHFDIEKMANSEIFTRVLTREFLRMQRHHEPIALINIDIDGYTSYEEEYGKEKTYQCLYRVGEVLFSRIKRAGDFIAYMGGDEFMILLPNTDQSGAVKMAEYLRLLVATLEIEHHQNASGIVTISLGVAQMIPDKNNSPQELREKAAKHLQQAKNQGRNCTRIG